jgi:glutaredoxin 3
MKSDIVMYSRASCGFCRRAASLLREKGVRFDVVDVAANPERTREMVERAGGRTTVPQIFIRGEHVGGCDELHALDALGRLDPLLEGVERVS